MIDLVKLQLKAGDGGHGKISFRREKYVPKGGPDGGIGGRGGDLILRLNPHMSTLQHLAGVKTIEAQRGENGSKRQKFGKAGESTVIEVPPGTVVWLLAENKVSRKRRQRYGIEWPLKRSEVAHQHFFIPEEGGAPLEVAPLDEAEPVAEEIDIESTQLDSLQQHDLPQVFEITEATPEVIIAQGGFGGRGNESFKAADKTTPLEAEYGTPGERKIVLFELKLLADVGFVGLPNAGKSTLLSRLTAARPKIANYPFTTLEPQLGVLIQDETEVVIADIPGLIPGAHEGKGLGIAFLKHLEHCQALVYVLAIEDMVILDDALSDVAKLDLLAEQLEVLKHELQAFDPNFVTKKSIVLVNKIDIYSADLIDALIKHSLYKSNALMLISAYTGEGLEPLKVALLKLV